MTTGKRPGGSAEDEIVNLDDGGTDDVARAIAEAERAVAAVERKHRAKSGQHEAPTHAVAGVTAATPVSVDDDDSIVIDADEMDAPVKADPREERLRQLHEQLASEKERALRAEEESGRLRETLLRKSADFENLKRRTEREKTDFFKFALSEAFRDLLPALDNFERALLHAPVTGEKDEFRTGIEMISRQMADILKKYGLVEVAAQGEHFDPNVHEAVMLEAAPDSAPGTVLEVFQKGYTLNDRLLRPALVKVSSAPAPPKEGEGAAGR